jgi:hypothetical protein
MRIDTDTEMQAWIADAAPREAPDWLLESVLRTTADLPQERSALRGALRRSRWLAALAGTAVAAALILALVVGISGWLRNVGVSAPPIQPAPTRPSDIPADGGCEADRQCLGLLGVGSYSFEYFHPPVTLRIPEDGWQNRRGSGGMVLLEPLDAPGDELLLLERAAPRTAENTLVPGSAQTASALVAWLEGRPDLDVTPPTATSLGALSGSMVDVTVRDDAPDGLSDCPAHPCVALARAQDPAEMPTWVWELTVWHGSALRIHILDVDGTALLVVVRAWDATQLDALAARVQPILDSLVFNR